MLIFKDQLVINFRCGGHILMLTLGNEVALSLGAAPPVVPVAARPPGKRPEPSRGMLSPGPDASALAAALAKLRGRAEFVPWCRRSRQNGATCCAHRWLRPDCLSSLVRTRPLLPGGCATLACVARERTEQSLGGCASVCSAWRVAARGGNRSRNRGKQPPRPGEMVSRGLARSWRTYENDGCFADAARLRIAWAQGVEMVAHEGHFSSVSGENYRACRPKLEVRRLAGEWLGLVQWWDHL